MKRQLVFLLLLTSLMRSVAIAEESLISARFSELPGWQEQTHHQALSAFVRSCGTSTRFSGVIKGRIDPRQWLRICDAAKTWPEPQARAFFEQHFRPYRWRRETAEGGLLTGYYVPLLEASLTQDAVYRWPVYAVPADFHTPYLTRRQINQGALDGKGLELVWLKDRVMRFFLHIQGSGLIELPDGRRMRLQFAAKNEQPYTAIGKILIEEGHLSAENVSLQSIRQYLYRHPMRQEEVFNHNDSYVFFQLEPDAQMPRGAQGVTLTPMHSLAVDRRQLPFGIPVWLVTQQTEDPIRTLAITQDTGSAIRGPQRGDLFFGAGQRAEQRAGPLKAHADWYLLLPR